MFYKRLLLILILITSVFSFTGCMQPDSDTKIKQTSMQYLKDKYNEDFEFQDLKTSANEGTGWLYVVHAIPKKNPDITVEARSKKGISNISDDYKKQKWDDVRGEQVKDLIETKFGKSTGFKMNFVANKEIENKYSLYTNPLDIIKNEANYKKGSTNGYYQPIYERVSVDISIGKEIKQDDIANNLISIINYYNDLNLYFELDLTLDKKKTSEGSNAESDSSFFNVVVTSNTIPEKNDIKKLIVLSK